MATFYASPDLTAFVSTREVDGWHVGVLSVLLGTRPREWKRSALPYEAPPRKRCRMHNAWPMQWLQPGETKSSFSATPPRACVRFAHRASRAWCVYG